MHRKFLQQEICNKSFSRIASHESDLLRVFHAGSVSKTDGAKVFIETDLYWPYNCQNLTLSVPILSSHQRIAKVGRTNFSTQFFNKILRITKSEMDVHLV
jgi:hypothetical protein